MTTDMTRLIEPLIPGLRRYARALLRDRTAADDLVQDCLEKVIGHWRQRRSESDTRSWVFAILHNLAVTRLRRRTSRPLHFSIDEGGRDELSLAAPQEDRLHYQALLKALAGLPEDHRAVLLLVGVEDLSYAETARALDIPIGTVMSRLSRARENLLKATSDATPSNFGSGRGHLRRIK